MFGIYKFRVHYWSCSSAADKINEWFGVTPKPKAATMEEWDQWHKENEEHSDKKVRIGYWITDSGLDYIQDTLLFIPDVYHEIRNYLNNRFITKSHCLNTGLKKGQWYDLDTRILNGLFNELKLFVEEEKAHMQHISNFPDKPVKSNPRDDGMRYLDWEISLGDESPHQSAVAKEIKFLYNWWLDRNNRADPYDSWGADEKPSKEQMDECFKIKQSYEDEDESMIIRLIKIRKGLWT